MEVIHEKAYREMAMREVHTVQQCFELYKREGVKVIEHTGTYGGYHHFKEYYSATV